MNLHTCSGPMPPLGTAPPACGSKPLRAPSAPAPPIGLRLGLRCDARLGSRFSSSRGECASASSFSAGAGAGAGAGSGTDVARTGSWAAAKGERWTPASCWAGSMGPLGCFCLLSMRARRFFFFCLAPGFSSSDSESGAPQAPPVRSLRVLQCAPALVRERLCTAT